MINIVILMAGEGSRFKNQGYEKAKPFIKFNGKMMIEHVLDSIKCPDAIYTLVIKKIFLKDYRTELEYLKNKYLIGFSIVEKTTLGALCTALSAYDKIQPYYPVIFVDSDNIYSNNVFSRFAEDSMMSGRDGNLLTFNSRDSKFSFAKLSESTGLVSEIREKRVISNNAIAGAYMFGSSSMFIRTAIDTIIYPAYEKEYFMSSAYETLINKNGRVGIFNISESDFNCVGTPAQLELFLKKGSFTSSDKY